ncbi:MAG: hypothetical protein GY761_14770 [Hyphomicrobiales bacterium]|nr:hypothetical protein [Hyphomicrobiales bacterium]
MELLTFNASQYETVDHFRQVWDEVRLKSVAGPVMCFIDEFDVAHCKWLGHFLAPANDGATFEPFKKTFGPKIVFIFGGGVFESRIKLEANIDRFEKLPDFARRMDAYIDLPPIAFPWEHTQDNHASLYKPTLEEELQVARTVVDYQKAELSVVQRDIDLYWDEDSGSLKPRTGKTRRKVYYKSGHGSHSSKYFEASSSLKTGLRKDDGAQLHLDKEVLFALLKRAIAYRYLLDNNNSNDYSDRSHLFKMKSSWEEWENDRKSNYPAIWEKSWIKKDVAWLLLHPAARLRSGLGSLEKYVQKIRFLQRDTLSIGMLPSYESTRHLIDFGPQDLQGSNTSSGPYNHAINNGSGDNPERCLINWALEANNAYEIWPRTVWK